jgi:hypothetical protein
MADDPAYEPKCEPFTRAEVEEAFLSLEATKDNFGLWWWGKRPVGDWRAAMHARILSNRKDTNAKRNTNPRGDDTRDHSQGF